MAIASILLLLLIDPPGARFGFDASVQDCVRFSSAKLAEGERFQFQLSPQLAFALVPRSRGDLGGWAIAVYDVSDTASRNLIPAVTPPLQSTPHLQFGPGYGLSARNSMFNRNLRFATGVADYQRAFEKAYARGKADDVETYLAFLEGLKLGELKIRILDFGTQPTTVDLGGFGNELLAWIAFDGEACFPK